MRACRLNQISGRFLLVLSLIALLTVLGGYLQPRQPAPVDEGAGAHIFQLSVVAVAPMLVLFLVTADWSRRWSSARPLAVPAALLVLAFAALYVLEHYYLLPS